jgi:hypothetical protein
VSRLPLLAHPKGKCGGGGTQKGGGVLQRDGGATDSSETTESMVFVVTVHDSDNRYIRGYPLPAGNRYEYDFLSVTGKVWIWVCCKG